MNNRLLLLISFLFFSDVAFSTAQQPERLKFNGREYALRVEPLEQYLSQFKVRPSFRNCDVTSSANWRGYYGLWEIEGEKLYLAELKESCAKRTEVVPGSGEIESELGWEFFKQKIELSKLFSETDKKVFAKWYSGILRMPYGKILHYVHMGYESVYENEKILLVKNGVITKEFDINYSRDVIDRSIADLIWVRLGDAPVTNSDFIDGRLWGTEYIEQFKYSLDEFAIRGIFFGSEHDGIMYKSNLLRIPGTPINGWGGYIDLGASKSNTIISGDHVEVSVKFELNMEDFTKPKLSLSKIRKLEYGESIHHPNYVEIAKAIDWPEEK